MAVDELVVVEERRHARMPPFDLSVLGCQGNGGDDCAVLCRYNIVNTGRSAVGRKLKIVCTQHFQSFENRV